MAREPSATTRTSNPSNARFSRRSAESARRPHHENAVYGEWLNLPRRRRGMLVPFVRAIALDRLTAVLASGVCLCVALLGWLGYRGISEWRRQSIALDAQRSVETADLLYEAVLRDMGGFQASVLNSPEWTRYNAERPHELSEFVASAFARYPYPNSLFAWRPDEDGDRMVFFYRTERRPRWLVAPAPETSFPIALQYDRAVARRLLPGVTDAASHSRRVSAISEALGDAPHQIVFQLLYADEYRQRLAIVVEFTVDLDWIRREYFTDLVDEIGHMATAGKAASNSRLPTHKASGLRARRCKATARSFNAASSGCCSSRPTPLL